MVAESLAASRCNDDGGKPPASAFDVSLDMDRGCVGVLDHVCFMRPILYICHSLPFAYVYSASASDVWHVKISPRENVRPPFPV